MGKESPANQAAEIVDEQLWADIRELTTRLDMAEEGEIELDWGDVVETVIELNSTIRLIAGDNDELYEKGRCRLFKTGETDETLEYCTLMGAEEIDVE